VALTWFGDGSTSRGDFHEAMNWAGVQKLPVVFVLENNQYAYSTPLHQQFAVDPVERAAVYGFPGYKVDGNDAEAVRDAAADAVARARAGDGPTLVECETYRIRGHYEGDPQPYRTQDEVEEWKRRDPLAIAEARLRERGELDDAVRAEIHDEARRLVEDAVAFAESEPPPDPAEALEDVYASVAEASTP
jgi:TPP-dependent pyruvate/acetoin dehydrogenase alpha subunit